MTTAPVASQEIGKPMSNMYLWRKVERTDPKHTKKVNQRGGFTAISAHYQVMSATEQFGPIGVGWGYHASDPIVLDGLVTVGVTIWHGSRENEYGPVWGGAELRGSNGKLDSDAPKKAGTDGLTKALSQLGFNADVFLGRFDDNKYVQRMEREFAGGNQPAPANDTPPANGKVPAHSALKTELRQFVRELEGIGDWDTYCVFRDTADFKRLVAECQEKLPQWWNGWPEQPDGFTPLRRRIELLETNLAQDIADIGATG